MLCRRTYKNQLHESCHLIVRAREQNNLSTTLFVCVRGALFPSSKNYKNYKVINGFTPDQQFFLNFARGFFINFRPERLKLLVQMDPHAPGICRVNETLANMPQFQKAFDIPNKSPMVNENRCVLW